MKKTFTFVIEYQGGTYIRQLRAVDTHCATVDLLGKMVNDGYFNMGEEDANLNVKNIEDGIDAPVQIEGCDSVWFHVISIGNKKAYLNIVATLV